MERRINGPDAELLPPEEAAKWLGIPYTTFKDWIRFNQVPGPQSANRLVTFYSWDQVYAIRVLLGSGFLPLPKREKPPAEG